MSRICLVVLLGLSLAINAFAVYDITAIGDPGTFGSTPVINNDGIMAWVYNDGATTDIVTFDGTKILRLETPGWEDSSPSINQLGQIAWVATSGGVCDIFVWDGTTIRRMYTTCGSVRLPQISPSGAIAWEGTSGTPGVYYYDGSDILQLSALSGYAYNLSLNSSGVIVWSEDRYYTSSWQLYAFDGVNNLQITSANQYNVRPQINDAGEVVWQGFDGSDWDIYLRTDDGISRLNNPGCVDMYPRINSVGEVVWSSTQNGSTDICFWNGQEVLRLTTPGTDSNPQISDSGTIVWESFDGTDVEIMMYDGTNITQLTDNDVNDIRPWVNSEGEVTWQRIGGGGSQIILAEPADKTPPKIGAVNASPNVLWPPNHQMVPIVVTVDATDDRSTPVSRILKVVSNEPDGGTGSGDLASDWKLTGSLALDLRAEKAASGAGRTYTITVECEDAAGNTSTADVIVRVPQSQKK